MRGRDFRTRRQHRRAENVPPPGRVRAQIAQRTVGHEGVKQPGLAKRRRVAGQVAMIGARFAGTLTAESLQVGAALLMASQAQHKTKFKDVDLKHAKIAGNVDMHGAVFDGSLTASSLEVGGGLIMASNTHFKDVNLAGTEISKGIAMSGSRFDGPRIVAFG